MKQGGCMLRDTRISAMQRGYVTADQLLALTARYEQQRGGGGDDGGGGGRGQRSLPWPRVLTFLTAVVFFNKPTQSISPAASPLTARRASHATHRKSLVARRVRHHQSPCRMPHLRHPHLPPRSELRPRTTDVRRYLQLQTTTTMDDGRTLLPRRKNEECKFRARGMVLTERHETER